MKRKWFFLMMLVVVFSQTHGQQNLLVNGGFEKTTPDGNDLAPILGWQRSHSPREAGCNINTDAAKEGYSGIWLYTAAGQKANCKPYQDIKGQSQVTYTAEAWFRHPPETPWTTGSKAYLSLDFKNAYGVTIESKYSEEMVKGYTEWKKLTLTATAPQNCTKVGFTVNLTSQAGQSVITVDNCALFIPPGINKK